MTREELIEKLAFRLYQGDPDCTQVSFEQCNRNGWYTECADVAVRALREMKMLKAFEPTKEEEDDESKQFDKGGIFFIPEDDSQPRALLYLFEDNIKADVGFYKILKNNRIQMIRAYGTGIEFIGNNFPGVPVIKGWRCEWYGDMAEFIARNIQINLGDVVINA